MGIEEQANKLGLELSEDGFYLIVDKPGTVVQAQSLIGVGIKIVAPDVIVKFCSIEDYPDDGIQCIGELAQNFKIQANVFKHPCSYEEQDEAISVVHGAANDHPGYIQNNVFYGVEKCILINNENPDHVLDEIGTTVFIEGNTFNKCARRMPYVKRGGCAVCRGNVIENWRPGYKSYGMRVLSGGELYVENCSFLQDSRFPSGIFSYIVDRIRGGGSEKGIIHEGGDLEVLNCKKNQSWIKLG